MKDTKNIVIGVVGVIILVLAFLYFRGGDATVSSGLVAGNAVTSEVTSFISQVSAIKSVTLSKKVFENKVLVNGLKDETRELTAEEKGRTNPFSPLGGSKAPAVSYSAKTVSTPVAPSSSLSD